MKELGSDGLVDMLPAVDPQGPCDAVFLLKRTGVLLGAWTRAPMPLEVVSVMTATLLGSVDSMVQALCHSTPEIVRVETENCQLFATRLGSRHSLVLIAPRSVQETQLRRAAREIVAHLQAQGEVPLQPHESLPAMIRKAT